MFDTQGFHYSFNDGDGSQSRCWNRIGNISAQKSVVEKIIKNQACILTAEARNA